MTNTDIPFGFCECGCGQRTALAKQNDKRRGLVKGRPIRFVSGHNSRVANPASRAPRGEGYDYVIADRGYATPCWIWQKYVTRTGYGRLKRSGKHGPAKLAHRWYYEQTHGPIPDALPLDHLCRVPLCVNPDHLEPVTIAENNRRGKNVKLTADQAREIYLSTESPQRRIAERYGVSLSTVEYIKSGRLWRDVTGASNAGSPSRVVRPSR